MSLNPRDAVIVDYARSAMGRSKNGCFRNVRADDLSVGVIKGLLARNEALDPAEIDWYVSTEEPLDKAGAYGIQGRAGAFIPWINGSFSAVVGLPLAETATLLRAAGVRP